MFPGKPANAAAGWSASWHAGHAFHIKMPSGLMRCAICARCMDARQPIADGPPAMLFLLKRDWKSALAALVVLAGLGLALRHFLSIGPEIAISWANAVLGLAVLAGTLLSDSL